MDTNASDSFRYCCSYRIEEVIFIHIILLGDIILHKVLRTRRGSESGICVDNRMVRSMCDRARGVRVRFICFCWTRQNKREAAFIVLPSDVDR
jgi:hypothetical protein